MSNGIVAAVLIEPAFAVVEIGTRGARFGRGNQALWTGCRVALLLVGKQIQRRGALAVLDVRRIVADAAHQRFVQRGLQAQLLHRGGAAADIQSAQVRVLQGAARVSIKDQRGHRGLSGRHDFTVGVEIQRRNGRGLGIIPPTHGGLARSAEKLCFETVWVFFLGDFLLAALDALVALFLHFQQHTVKICGPDEPFVVFNSFGLICEKIGTRM